MPLTSLPAEIILTIADVLSRGDLIHLTLACKNLSTLLNLVLHAPLRKLSTANRVLRWGIQQPSIPIVKLALSHGATEHSTTENDIFNCSAITLAACFNQRDIVVLLLEHYGSDAVNSPGDCHPTALQAATHPGYEKMLELLLSRGADVNRRGQGWMYPLGLAALEATAGVARLFIDAGAELEATTVARTAMQVAMEEGNMGVAKVLASAGARMCPEAWGRWVEQCRGLTEEGVRAVLINYKEEDVPGV